MKILLDENLPRKLVAALRVALPQKPQDEFIVDFLAAFRAVDLEHFQHANGWQ